MLAAAAALSLLAGIGLGMNLERSRAPTREDTATSPAKPVLVGGNVLSVAGQDRDYLVSVYNPGTAPIEVLYLEANTISPPVRALPRAGTIIAPGTWHWIGLRLPGGCSYVDPAKLLAVVTRGPATERVLVPLPQVSHVLEDHFVLRCSTRQRPTVAALAGLWSVAPESRRPTAGRLVLQFTPDGRFASQDEVSREWDIAGRYRLLDDRLVINVERGHTFTCGPGDRLTWRAALLEDGRLALDFSERREDACGEPAGTTWVAFRLLGEMSRFGPSA
jgi:hypothetical protein